VIVAAVEFRCRDRAATSDNLQSDNCKIPGHAYLLENPSDFSFENHPDPSTSGATFPGNSGLCADML
jgi:hypothetical protein